MRVAFRADASREIGSGHVRRCAALAAAIVARGGEVRFLVRESGVDVQNLVPGRLDRLVAAESTTTPDPHAPAHSHWLTVSQSSDAAECLQLLSDWQPDWVVVDHYAIDARWHEQLGSTLGCRIAAIDDLGDRRLSVDALIDHNWHADHNAKYAGLLSRDCMMLCGPRHAMLGEAYADAPRYAFNADVRSIGIFMGGTDPGNLTLIALDAARRAGFSGAVEIAITSANPNLEHVLSRAAAEPAVTVTVDLPNLAAFFARHDLQLGAGGGATWERFCIGGPSLLLAFAANQDSVLEPLAALGVASVLPCGWNNQDLEQEIARLLTDHDLRNRYATRGQALVDGKGAYRVMHALMVGPPPQVSVRPATFEDARNMHQWRNDARVRNFSRMTDEISYAVHCEWLTQSLSAPDRVILMGMDDTCKPVGVVRFDCKAGNEVEVSIYLDPERGGEGLGGPMLDAAERYFANSHNCVVDIIAVTMPGNRASERLFENGGYHRTDSGYRKQLIK